MFMQIAVSIIGILMFCSPASAVECKSELIGIAVYFYSQGKEWATTWKANGVHKIKTDYSSNRKEGDRTNVHDSHGFISTKSLPQTLLTPDKQFNVPFDISQCGKHLIAAIYKKDEISYRSKQFAIVDLKKQKIVQIVETEYGIEALAWAPDGKYFAVLYEQDVTKEVFKGPLDWLADFVGHTIGYWTFYLTIYQPDGTVLCTKQVAEKLPNAMSYIDWEKQIDK